MNLKFAIRVLKNDPWFFLPAILILALGIGASTAMFSVVDAVLLRPLPYHDSDCIVFPMTYFEKTGRRGSVSMLDFHDWEAQSSSFESMAAYRSPVGNIVANGSAARGQVTFATRDLFAVMSVQPFLGRSFNADEDRPGGRPVAMISYGLWQRQFGGDPDAIGKPLRTNLRDETFTVVGVLPPGFTFPGSTDLWLPANQTHDMRETRDAHNYTAIARLKRGVSLQQAETEMRSIAARLERQYPENATKSAVVVPMREQVVKDVRSSLVLLFAGVLVILIIACANVINLLLAKAAKRDHEIAVRTALGATRLRLMRQLLVEGLVLVVPAALLGITIAYWGVRAFLLLAPANLPRLHEVGVNLRVLGFALAVSVVASMLFALAPLHQQDEFELTDSLNRGGMRAITAGVAAMRAALVVVELALSVALLITAGLLTRSLVELQRTDPGYRRDRVLVASSSASPSQKPGDRRGPYFYQESLASISQLPGVEAVAGSSNLPSSMSSNGRYQVDGKARVLGDFVTQQAAFVVVTPAYFQALGIPLVSGRDFDSSDTLEHPLTCIINQALVRDVFRGQEPIGHRIQTGMDGSGMMIVVGVVADVREYGLDRAPSPEIYMPYLQHPGRGSSMFTLVRTHSDPMRLADSVRTEFQRLDPNVPVTFTTLEESLGQTLAAPRFRTVLLGSFALVALVLSVVGLYAVLSYMVSHRTRELALRMALGARPGDVLWMIMAQGLALLVPGVMIGVAVAFAASGLISSVLYSVRVADSRTLIAVPVLMLTVALAALYRPARSAAKVDPAIALRRE